MKTGQRDVNVRCTSVPVVESVKRAHEEVVGESRLMSTHRRGFRQDVTIENGQVHRLAISFKYESGS